MMQLASAWSSDFVFCRERLTLPNDLRHPANSQPDASMGGLCAAIYDTLQQKSN